MGVRNGSLTEVDGKEHLSCLSKFLALVLHDMSCRMPKYCWGDRFLEEDGNCGLFFCRRSNRPLVWGLDTRHPPRFFEDVLFISDCIWMDLLTEGFEHGRWTRLPEESRRYGETWTGSASGVMVIVHARTHAHREHADVPSTSGKSFCLSRQTQLTCPNTEKKWDSGKGEIISMECSSSHSQCESVAKSGSEAMMDLMNLRADGSGGGQAVLNFVGLGTELIGQATGWKERACGSAVSSLKRKKSSVTVQSTVFECPSQELRWVLRGIFITQRTVFRSDLRISRDNYVVNLMPPLFESCQVPGDIHYIHDVMQPGSNHTLCNHRRQHVVVNILKSWIGIDIGINIFLEWSVPLEENFLANDIKKTIAVNKACFEDVLTESV